MRTSIENYAIAHAARNSEQAIEADLEFHRALVKAAKNPVLLSLLDSISGLLKEHRREYGIRDDSKRLTKVVVEHEAIVDALISREERVSVSRVARHMRMIWDQIEAVSANSEEVAHSEHPGWYFDLLIEDA